MNENALFGEATFQSLFGNLLQRNFFRRDFAKRQECRFPKTRGRRAAKFRPSEIARRGNEDRNVFAPMFPHEMRNKNNPMRRHAA